MKPLVSLREALADPQLLGGAIPGDSWQTWRILLVASMGEPLLDEERAIFTTITGRDDEPLERVEELWAIIGRRAGKTRGAGTLAAYVSGLCDHSDALAPGERGVLPILAASQDQATRCFQHVAGIIEHSPVLASEVQDRTADTIRLRTNIDVQIRPASYRTIRGVTAVGAVADEAAFWRAEDSMNPDREILDALRPALATTGGPLIVISSPYARRGELYATFKRDFGPTGDRRILVAKGPSRTFNPILPQSVVDRAYERDASVAAAEFGGEFRADVETFLNPDAVAECVEPGVIERPPVQGVSYVGFTDPSGGSSDSMTLAIAHVEGERAMLDALRERRAPFSPDDVVAEFAALLLSYGLGVVTGDRYGGEWPRERFRAYGIRYEPSPRSKSDIYRELPALINARQVELLDSPRLITQLCGLERRTARGGRDNIDHTPNSHDDLANAAAGALVVTIPRFTLPGMGLFELMRRETVTQPEPEVEMPTPARGSVEYRQLNGGQ